MAEKILQDTFKDELAFFSAGISPIAKASMDPRSIEFLTESNINDVYHMPKKINNKMIENSSKIDVKRLLHEWTNSKLEFNIHKKFSITTITDTLDLAWSFFFLKQENKNL